MTWLVGGIYRRPLDCLSEAFTGSKTSQKFTFYENSIEITFMKAF